MLPNIHQSMHLPNIPSKGSSTTNKQNPQKANSLSNVASNQEIKSNKTLPLVYPPSHMLNDISDLNDRLQQLEHDIYNINKQVQNCQEIISNSQQQQDNAKVSFTRLHEDLQQLGESFNAKLQSDISFQQREQQKAALLFAEVSRLSRTVELIESNQDKQSSFNIKSNECESCKVLPDLDKRIGAISNDLREVRQEVDRLVNLNAREETEALHKRIEMESIESMMDTKIHTKFSHLVDKYMTNKNETMQLLHDFRILWAENDSKRFSTQMMELNRLNDHFIGFEQWIYQEFGHLKRYIQCLKLNELNRITSLTCELQTYAQSWNSILQRQDANLRNRLHEYEVLLATKMSNLQKKILTLEEIFPMEVTARQKGDDKIHKRIDTTISHIDKIVAKMHMPGANYGFELNNKVSISPTKLMPSQCSSENNHVPQRSPDIENRKKAHTHEDHFQNDRDRIVTSFRTEIDTKMQQIRESIAEQVQCCKIELKKLSTEIMNDMQASVVQYTSHVQKEYSPYREDLKHWLRQYDIQKDVHQCVSFMTACLETQYHIERNDFNCNIQVIKTQVHKLQQEVQCIQIQEESINILIHQLQSWMTSNALETRQYLEYLQDFIDSNVVELHIQNVLDTIIEQIILKMTNE